ncbi:MAG: hydrogenase 3 maturation endopeptidase HyCI [Methanomicrobiaceae archaeon]|nr:hydrogenase 3 maturation endopeptidase HyCI [Methanomicrobiaceae archaeon]
MNMLLGIGNTLRRDDGIGCLVARRFSHAGWKAVECGTAPENFTAVVRRDRPDLLVLVDAADMGLAPGDLRRIPPEKIQDVGIGTHQLPLSHLIAFLAPDAGEIVFVGIQPESVADGEAISSTVMKGAERLMAAIRQGELDRIPLY